MRTRWTSFLCLALLFLFWKKRSQKNPRTWSVSSCIWDQRLWRDRVLAATFPLFLLFPLAKQPWKAAQVCSQYFVSMYFQLTNTHGVLELLSRVSYKCNNDGSYPSKLTLQHFSLVSTSVKLLWNSLRLRTTVRENWSSVVFWLPVNSQLVKIENYVRKQ